MQNHDTHHIHYDITDFYYFLILAPILTAVALYCMWKLMTYLENRKKPDSAAKSDEESVSKKGLK